jgi:phage baseplate assembly protein W
MANLLDRFNVAVRGSNEKLADYISTIAPSGDFKRIKDINVILNSWNNILLTPKRSYIFDPEYGSDLYKMVFEPADSDTAQAIQDEVVESIERYDDRALIQDIQVAFFNQRKGFSITIQVEYQGEPAELSLGIDETVYFKFFEVPVTD